jgi:hypothetical protein
MQFLKHLFAKFWPGSKPEKVALVLAPSEIELEDDYEEDGEEHSERQVDHVAILYQSEWSQEMNLECRQCIGKKDDRYYFALEISPSHDDEPWLNWRGPFLTVERAQEECDLAFDRWSDSFNRSWERWEDAQIVNVERPQSKQES